MRSRGLLDAIQHAVEGILTAYRTQRHVRFHFFAIIAVLSLAQTVGFDRMRMVLLFVVISLVMVSEMLNTAIEAAVDLVTDEYRPLAKNAKDVAAGAVLVASLNAFAVGCFLFFDQRRIHDWQAQAKSLWAQPEVSDLFMMVTVIVTIIVLAIFIWKLRSQKGSLLHGGIISGHSAVAFSLACIVTLTTMSWPVAFMAFFLAFLVSQSRVEGGIHTVQEAVWGAVLGVLVTLLMVQVLPRLLIGLIP